MINRAFLQAPWLITMVWIFRVEQTRLNRRAFFIYFYGSKICVRAFNLT
jgi:hypothetical protein